MNPSIIGIFLVLGRDADRGQQACQHHERHEHPGQRRVFRQCLR